MELGVSHVQNLSSLTPIIDNIFDKYNKNLVPIRSLSDHDSCIKESLFSIHSFQRMIRKMSDTIRGVRLTVQQLVCQNRSNTFCIVTFIW